MQSIRYVYGQDGDAWLGHLEEHLRDLHKDFTSSVFSVVRRVAEFAVS